MACRNDDFQGLRDRSTGTMLTLQQLPKPGSIAGKVWVDPDEDCVFDSGEEPLEGVTIELLDGGGNVIRTTTTNARANTSLMNWLRASTASASASPRAICRGARWPARTAATPASPTRSRSST